MTPGGLRALPLLIEEQLCDAYMTEGRVCVVDNEGRSNLIVGGDFGKWEELT